MPVSASELELLDVSPSLVSSRRDSLRASSSYEGLKHQSALKLIFIPAYMLRMVICGWKYLKKHSWKGMR
jgi:hypothetical protein